MRGDVAKWETENAKLVHGLGTWPREQVEWMLKWALCRLDQAQARVREQSDLLKMTTSENQRLRDRNVGLLLANELRKYKKPGGRPIRHTTKSDEEFFLVMIPWLHEHLGIPEGRGTLPKVLRRLNTSLPQAKRLTDAKLERQIKTIQNRSSKLKQAPVGR